VPVIPPPSLITRLPSDFFLFPKMKLELREQHFDITEEIQTKSQDMMNMLLQNVFGLCFRSWKSYWDCCIGTTSKEEANTNFDK
jgi:hypothetical protein